MTRVATLAVLVALAAACGASDKPTTTIAETSTTAATSTTSTAAPVTTTTATATATTTTITTPLPATAPLEVAGPGRYEVAVASGGLVRRFLLVVPESVSVPAPLVIVFHGFTRSPEEMERSSGMTALAEEHGFVVAYPAGTGFPRRWLSAPSQGDQDVRFARDLVSLIAAAVPIDPRRVYAAGMSNGGGMAARLACDAADLVAAVGPVAATLPSGPCDPARPVPVAAIHGTADPIVPYEGLGAALPGVGGVMADWVGRNGCDPDPATDELTADVVRVAWGGCAGGADVVLFRVDGGRHGWPGSGDASLWGRTADSVDASALLWEFFAAHPMP
ncbi:MAG: PHB depolymerase family esterase [Actinomycetota bacterium]